MANITSIGGNPIVPAAVQPNTVTDAMLKQTGGVLEEVQEIGELTTSVDESWDSVALTTQSGWYYYKTGEYTSENGRSASTKIPVTEGERYRVSTHTRSAVIAGILFFDSNDDVSSYDLLGNGTLVEVVNYEFTVPQGAATLVVQSADGTAPTLGKYRSERSFIGYTKPEVNAMLATAARYGVRWDVTDPDDLGERCFSAVGMSATIGIGATSGSSGFDSIYPWSGMKRCNIKSNANGAKIVTFEGESGFALDGSNGDVFVRIPKFYYERYRDGDYEYRVVSSSGANVHPAFIEDGRELDEIFIGAFEGFVDGNGKLRSQGGVLPTSNLVGQAFLTAAQANGTEYSLYDMRCVDAVWTLLAVEFGCRNTNRIFGYGLADFMQPTNIPDAGKVIQAATGTNTVRAGKAPDYFKAMMPVGSNITVCGTTQQNILTQAKIISCVDGTDYTDWTFDGQAIDVDTDCFIGSAAFDTNFCESEPSGALSWHTGRGNWIVGSDTRNPMRYRWIENIFGNLWHFLPDVTFNDYQMYVCKNMRDYVMHKHESPYIPVGAIFTANDYDNGVKADTAGSNYWVTELDNDLFAKGVSFGRQYDKDLVSTKAFGSYYYLRTGTMCIVNGGGFDHLYRCNMLTQRAWIDSANRWYLYGARLMFKRI